jgi:hypothetical protein
MPVHFAILASRRTFVHLTLQTTGTSPSRQTLCETKPTGINLKKDTHSDRARLQNKLRFDIITHIDLNSIASR